MSLVYVLKPLITKITIDLYPEVIYLDPIQPLHWLIEVLRRRDSGKCLPFFEKTTHSLRGRNTLGRGDRTLALPACRVFSEFRTTRVFRLLFYFLAKIDTTCCLDRLPLEDDIFLLELSKCMSLKIVLLGTSFLQMITTHSAVIVIS